MRMPAYYRNLPVAQKTLLAGMLVGLVAALGLTPEALALCARRLRRAREALDHAAQSFLDAHSKMSEAGYAVIDPKALRSAPQEIGLRALARLIAMVGGAEEPLRLAKLEALLASFTESPDKAHTFGRCRLQPFSNRIGIFREVRGEGLPVARLLPGERALWDNRFRIELGAEEHEPITVRALGDQGLRDLRDSSTLLASLPRLAGRTLPACWRGDRLVGVPSEPTDQAWLFQPLHCQTCTMVPLWVGVTTSASRHRPSWLLTKTLVAA